MLDSLVRSDFFLSSSSSRPACLTLYIGVLISGQKENVNKTEWRKHLTKQERRHDNDNKTENWIIKKKLFNWYKIKNVYQINTFLCFLSSSPQGCVVHRSLFCLLIKKSSQIALKSRQLCELMSCSFKTKSHIIYWPINRARIMRDYSTSHPTPLKREPLFPNKPIVQPSFIQTQRCIIAISRELPRLRFKFDSIKSICIMFNFLLSALSDILPRSIWLASRSNNEAELFLWNNKQKFISNKKPVCSPI